MLWVNFSLIESDPVLFFIILFNNNYCFISIVKQCLIKTIPLFKSQACLAKHKCSSVQINMSSVFLLFIYSLLLLLLLLLLLCKLECFIGISTIDWEKPYLHTWKITIIFRVFEIANQLMTRHSLSFTPWINDNLNKVDFFLLVRYLYNKQNNTWVRRDMEFLFECFSLLPYYGWLITPKSWRKMSKLTCNILSCVKLRSSYSNVSFDEKLTLFPEKNE